MMMGINLIGEKWIITDGIQMENKGQLINEKRGQEPDLEGVCVCVCVRERDGEGQEMSLE